LETAYTRDDPAALEPLQLRLTYETVMVTLLITRATLQAPAKSPVEGFALLRAQSVHGIHRRGSP
jgi:hypothetical protein